MQAFNDAARLLRVPSLLPGAVAVLFVALGQAVAGTFMALFAVPASRPVTRRAQRVPDRLGPDEHRCIDMLGRRFDRHPGAAVLLVVLAMNVAGFALLATTTDFFWLVMVAAFPVGVGGAAFTLLFALAKRQLDAVDAITAERGVAALRMTSSVAWAIGPALGAVLVGYRGYPGVFLGAAAALSLRWLRLSFPDLAPSGEREDGCDGTHRACAEGPGGFRSRQHRAVSHGDVHGVDRAVDHHGRAPGRQ